MTGERDEWLCLSCDEWLDMVEFGEWLWLVRW